MTNKLVMTVLMSLAACVGGEDDAATESWLGNWNKIGTQSTTCGAASGMNQVSGLVVIEDGPEDGTIQTFDNSCTLVWDLDGGTATLRPEQICTVNVNGFNVTVLWTASRATLAAGAMTGTTSGATNNGCSFTQQLTLTRQ